MYQYIQCACFYSFCKNVRHVSATDKDRAVCTVTTVTSNIYFHSKVFR